ncbi:hypothetical protein EMCG_09358 [[Emmonsia] crescens]|uniref:Uncharacterized protein n=1 Tax=[Emmonsia] crescens TaxID=73230 RepID=A0A0G2J9X5_9EURO|nr:hypothetical protein EMCG_09358 [Emmonsia crescens UAMH 3008]
MLGVVLLQPQIRSMDSTIRTKILTRTLPFQIPYFRVSICSLLLRMILRMPRTAWYQSMCSACTGTDILVWKKGLQFASRSITASESDLKRTKTQIVRLKSMRSLTSCFMRACPSRLAGGQVGKLRFSACHLSRNTSNTPNQESSQCSPRELRIIL